MKGMAHQEKIDNEKMKAMIRSHRKQFKVLEKSHGLELRQVKSKAESAIKRTMRKQKHLDDMIAYYDSQAQKLNALINSVNSNDTERKMIVDEISKRSAVLSDRNKRVEGIQSEFNTVRSTTDRMYQ